MGRQGFDPGCGLVVAVGEGSVTGQLAEKAGEMCWISKPADLADVLGGKIGLNEHFFRFIDPDVS